MLKKFTKPALALGLALTTASTVLAQDGTNNDGGLNDLLLGGGVLGLVVVVVLGFVLWQFFFGSGGD